MKSRSVNPFRLPVAFLEREKSFLGKQQLYVLVYYTAATVVGLCTNLTGMSGPQKDFNLWLNLGLFIAAVIPFTGYILHRISITAAISGIIMTTQVATSVEMLYCAFTPDEYHLMLIVGNTVLLAVNILFSLVAYLAYTPYILCGIGMGTYFACVRITENGALGNFFILLLVIFIAVCVLGSRLVKNTRLLDKENISLKKDEEELFNMLGLEKGQVKACMELAQKEHDIDRTGTLLGMLGEDLRRHVIANVKEYLSAQEAGMLEMETLFPELSTSEREICRLILQDKKLNDICAILGKKESNINSTRAHIRKKLNMKPSDNLRKVLQERAGKKSGTTD